MSQESNKHEFAPLTAGLISSSQPRSPLPGLLHMNPPSLLKEGGWVWEEEEISLNSHVGEGICRVLERHY